MLVAWEWSAGRLSHGDLREEPACPVWDLHDFLPLLDEGLLGGRVGAFSPICFPPPSTLLLWLEPV